MRGGELLLKKANSGVSTGKWNGPGGKLESGETPLQNVLREVMEETSLRIIDPFYHGKIEFCMNGRTEPDYYVHVFSARKFSGTPRSSDEGRIRWFGLARIPYPKMWDDDRYWLPLLLSGIKFDARFAYDKENRRVAEYEIKSRPSV